MKIIYLLGTDGAGKTTVSTRLAQRGFAGRRLRYVYCQLTPILLAPFKLLARLFFLRKTDRFQDYRTYQARKASVGGRRRLLTRAYGAIWLVDQAWQAWFKLLWARLRGAETVIMDRYYLDSVVNVGVLLGNDLDGMLSAARKVERFLPRPELFLFLNVSEAVAYQRKTDIPSPEYLRERKDRYLRLAEPYRFHQINADQPLDTVIDEASKVITCFFKKDVD